MIRFTSFMMEEGIPTYLQILLHIKRGIVSGEIVDGNELPSRRALSTLLGVNPNTVQKAYRILEDEGLIQSQSGAKSNMTLDASKIRAVHDELLGEHLGCVVSELKQMGLTLSEAIRLIEMHWED